VTIQLTPHFSTCYGCCWLLAELLLLPRCWLLRLLLLSPATTAAGMIAMTVVLPPVPVLLYSQGNQLLS